MGEVVVWVRLWCGRGCGEVVVWAMIHEFSCGVAVIYDLVV